MKSNNVMRMLDSKNVLYEAFLHSPQKRSAIEAANLLGVSAEKVFKTIVIVRAEKGKPILAIVPGTAEVDLKALAKTIGEKKVLMPTEREAERLTGLQAGGISPLALINRGFQVILDNSALEHNEIYISGGERGLNIRLAAKDLISLTNAQVAQIRRI